MGKRRLMMAAAAFLLVGGAAVLAALFSPNLQHGPTVNVLVTTAAVSPGEALGPGVASVMSVGLPSNLQGAPLPAGTNLSGSIATVGLPAGAILYPSDVTPKAVAGTVQMTLTLKASPTLAMGNVIDLFTIGTAGGSPTVQLVLRNLVVISASGSGVVVRVPNALAPSMVYLSTTPLVAVETVVGGDSVPAAVIQSEAQALAVVASAHHSVG